MKHVLAAITVIFILATVTIAGADCAGENVCQETDGTVQAVVDYLLGGGLKHPESYQGLGWSDLIVSPSTGYWVVNHKYRAQNDYGQTITKTRTFALDLYGQVVFSMDKAN